MKSTSNRERRSSRATVKKKLPPGTKLRRYAVMAGLPMGFAALYPSYDRMPDTVGWVERSETPQCMRPPATVGCLWTGT